MKRIIGIIMLILFILGMFSITVMDIGFMKALLVWGISIFIASWIIAALYLIINGKPSHK